MFSDLINTLTLKKWLAIGAIVAIAVVSGYFMLSSQADTNKGAFGGSFGGGVKTLGGTEKEDSQLKTAAQLAEEKAGQAAGEKKQDTTLKTAAELEADKAAESPDAKNAAEPKKITLTSSPNQPQKSEIQFPFTDENTNPYVPILSFTINSPALVQNPFEKITFANSGTLDVSNLDIIITNRLNKTSDQHSLEINTIGLHLGEGDNPIVVKVRAKADAATENINKKTLSLTLANANAFTLNNGFELAYNPANSPFPIESANFSAKVVEAAAVPEIPVAVGIVVVENLVRISADNDTIPARPIPLSDTPTAVFGFTLNPREQTSLNALTVSLDAGVENALNSALLQAAVFTQSGDSAERSVSGYVTQVDGTFSWTFKGVGLSPNRDTHIIIKVKIAEDAVAGKNFRFKIARASNITLGNDKTVQLSEGGLIGNTMITSASVPTEIICQENAPCSNTVAATATTEATLIPGTDTPTTVLGFTFDPSPTTTMQGVRITLDSTVDEPRAPANRLKAFLFVIDPSSDEANAHGEVQLAGPIDVNNGVFIFDSINRPLSADTPTQFNVSVRVPAGANVFVPQNFKLKIAASRDITLSTGHQAVFPEEGISGGRMSIAAAACADGLIPNEAGNACEEATPPPPTPLVCADNEHDENGACVLNGEIIPPATDVCANIDGPQIAPPAGYKIEGNSCVEMVDLCPLSPDGIQETIPAGTTLNASGACVAVVQTPPTCAANQQLNAAGTACVAATPIEEQVFACSNIGYFNYVGPARPDTPQNTCVPCESALYNSSNKSCEDPVGEGSNDGNNDRTSGDSSGGSSSRGAAFEGDASGQAPFGSMDLAQSQRLTYVPERGNTGPGILIYILGGGLAPAVAYGLRRMKK